MERAHIISCQYNVSLSDGETEFISDHLGGAAHSEVKFRITLSKSSPKEIVDILKEVFGGKETITQLQQNYLVVTKNLESH